MPVDSTQAEQEIRLWLQQAVIGLNLCPFASKPLAEGRVRIRVSQESDKALLLHLLFDELMLLEETAVEETETTLLVLTGALQQFDEYIRFLDLAEQLLIDRNWSGVFQIASFHPQYRFEGTRPDAEENLTNRSPYPVLHLLREESLARAIAAHPDTEAIPGHNIQRMKNLTEEEKQRIFPYLFPK